MTMQMLFLHQNFPAQFVHVARALQAAGHKCVALVPHTNTRPRLVPTETYQFEVRPGTNELGGHYAERAERGASAADGMLRLKAAGFEPDVVVGHGGWGETLFVRDVWPKARIILHAEFYYSQESADYGFDPEFAGLNTLSSAIRLRARNAAMLQALVDADVGVAPTAWQAGRFPAAFQDRLQIVHEGINTALACPDKGASVKLGRDNLILHPGDEVVTFVSRNLEPYRGYHSFMRALPEILARRPNARVVIVGGDKVSYGPALPDGKSWKQYFLDEAVGRIDLSRVHFVGTIPHSVFLQLMQVSAAHVYLTYPFVLSWSMLEAMSAGAPVIGSRTAPVEEVIEHGKNGLLVDFFDAVQIANTVVEMLERQDDFGDMRLAARETIIDRFDLNRVCLPAWLKLVRDQAAIAAGSDFGARETQAIQAIGAAA